MKAKLSDEVYEVDGVLDKKVQNRKCFYLVSWKGYPIQEATWESSQNITLTYYFDMYDKALKRKKTKIASITTNTQSPEKQTKKYKKKQFGVRSITLPQNDDFKATLIDSQNRQERKEFVNKIDQQLQNLNLQQIKNQGLKKMAPQFDKKQIKQVNILKNCSNSQQQLIVSKNQENLTNKQGNQEGNIKFIKKIIKMQQKRIALVQYEDKNQVYIPYDQIRNKHVNLIIDYLQSKFLEMNISFPQKNHIHNLHRSNNQNQVSKSKSSSKK